MIKEYALPVIAFLFSLYVLFVVSKDFFVVNKKIVQLLDENFKKMGVELLGDAVSNLATSL